MGQHQNLPDVSLEARPRYSLIVDEDIKKPNQTNLSINQPFNRPQVNFNEPLSMLQRIMLEMEYVEILCNAPKTIYRPINQLKCCNQSIVHASPGELQRAAVDAAAYHGGDGVRRDPGPGRQVSGLGRADGLGGSLHRVRLRHHAVPGGQALQPAPRGDFRVRPDGRPRLEGHLRAGKAMCSCWVAYRGVFWFR